VSTYLSAVFLSSTPDRSDRGYLVRQDRMRFGIAGAGLIARQAHVPAVLSLRDIELTAIVDLVPARARGLAKEYGISPIVATQLDSVADQLDALIITTPNDSHAALACAAVEAGLHVLIEKPLATSLRDAEMVVATARRVGKLVAVGYATRFRDGVLLLEHLLRSRYFGNVYRYAYQFGTPGGWSSLSAYSLSRKATGGGVLMVTGTHFIDRALHLFGYPQEFAYSDDSEGGPEANAIMWTRHTDRGGDVAGFARFSKTVRLPAGLVIETEHGAIVMGETDSSDVIWRPRTGRAAGIEHIVRNRLMDAFDARLSVFQRQLRNFVDACRGETDLVVDGAQALQSLRLIEALYARRTPMNQRWYDVDPRSRPSS
jgi:predicted dehydrogenase